MLQHPEQLAQLRANPELLPGAIDEFLRYESPVQLVLRVAREALEFHGQFIRAGQRVFPAPGAANRDPEQFTDPDRFDLHRTPDPHLSFGHGIHFCLGMPLARLETRIAFATLLQRCPGLTLTTDSITYRPGVTIRGLTALPVTFDPTGVSYQEPVQNMPEQSSLAALTATAGCPFHRQNT